MLSSPRTPLVRRVAAAPSFVPWLAFAALAAGLSAQEVQEPPPPPPPQPAARQPATDAGAAMFAPRTWPARLHHPRHADAVRAIERGLEWLRQHQADDGHWDADHFLTKGTGDLDPAEIGAGNGVHDIAVTGLAMFALGREGAPPATDPDHGRLERAASWLVQRQQGNGLLGKAASMDFIYDHATGTIGLLMAAHALQSTDLRAAAQRAIGYLEQHRNPYMVWRYQPRDGDNDMSVTTWCTLACASARHFGLQVTPPVFDAIDGWVGQMTAEDGRIGYTRPGEPSSRKPGNHVARFPPKACETLTAAGLTCRAALGAAAPLDGTAGRSVELVDGCTPTWQPDRGAVDYCYWFFGGEAMRQFGGAQREAWQQQLVAALTAGQRGEGPFAGSWDPVDAWGTDGGRVCSTAMAVLALQTVYATAH